MFIKINLSNPPPSHPPAALVSVNIVLTVTVSNIQIFWPFFIRFAHKLTLLRGKKVASMDEPVPVLLKEELVVQHLYYQILSFMSTPLILKNYPWTTVLLAIAMLLMLPIF